MNVFVEREGKPMIEFNFPGPIEEEVSDCMDGIKAVVTPIDDKYRVNIYSDSCLVSSWMHERQMSQLKHKITSL
jgi:hypothetical protein